MKKAAVIGNPIEHSWSPLIHGFWLKEAGINAAYEKIKVAPDELESFILTASKKGYSGINVTVPYKEEALKMCDNLSETAKALGAVNLIKFEGNKVFGDNTDGDGFIKSILTKLPNISFQNNNFAILGAGGAAKSIAHALKKNDAKKIIIINRGEEKAKALADQIGEISSYYGLSEIKKGLKKSSFLINSTTMGMKGGPEPIRINFSDYPNILCFADIVYNPTTTKLMKSASLAGIKVVGGIGVLINQAIPSFYSFYGEAPKNIEGLYNFINNKIIDSKND